MKEFIRHFKREAAGRWVCTEPADLKLPQGRIQVTPGSRLVRGTTFMGVDLARMLDEHYENETKKS